MKPNYTISADYLKAFDNATCYLHGGRIPVIGHGHASRRFISEGLVLPLLPLLADNKEERVRLAAASAPWYKRLGNSCMNGLNNIADNINKFIDHVCDLYDAEMNKQFIPLNDLAYIEPPKDVEPKEDEEVPEEKEVQV